MSGFFFILLLLWVITVVASRKIRRTLTDVDDLQPKAYEQSASTDDEYLFSDEEHSSFMEDDEEIDAPDPIRSAFDHFFFGEDEVKVEEPRVTKVDPLSEAAPAPKNSVKVKVAETQDTDGEQPFDLRQAVIYNAILTNPYIESQYNSAN